MHIQLTSLAFARAAGCSTWWRERENGPRREPSHRLVHGLSTIPVESRVGVTPPSSPIRISLLCDRLCLVPERVHLLERRRAVRHPGVLEAALHVLEPFDEAADGPAQRLLRRHRELAREVHDGEQQ